MSNKLNIVAMCNTCHKEISIGQFVDRQLTDGLIYGFECNDCGWKRLQSESKEWQKEIDDYRKE